MAVIRVASTIDLDDNHLTSGKKLFFQNCRGPPLRDKGGSTFFLVFQENYLCYSIQGEVLIHPR